MMTKQTRNLPSLLITEQHMAIRNGPLSFEQGFMLTLSAQRQFIRQVLANASPELADKLYDIINSAYGAVLADLFPEFHNAHITPELIDKTIAAQDAFIQAAIDELAQNDNEQA